MSIQLYRDIEAAINDQAGNPEAFKSGVETHEVRRAVAEAAREKSLRPEFQRFFPNEAPGTSLSNGH